MHRDLSPHLHTEDCNKVIAVYKSCLSEVNATRLNSVVAWPFCCSMQESKLLILLFVAGRSAPFPLAPMHRPVAVHSCSHCACPSRSTGLICLSRKFWVFQRFCFEAISRMSAFGVSSSCQPLLPAPTEEILGRVHSSLLQDDCLFEK